MKRPVHIRSRFDGNAIKVAVYRCLEQFRVLEFNKESRPVEIVPEFDRRAVTIATPDSARKTPGQSASAA